MTEALAAAARARSSAYRRTRGSGDHCCVIVHVRGKCGNALVWLDVFSHTADSRANGASSLVFGDRLGQNQFRTQTKRGGQTGAAIDNCDGDGVVCRSFRGGKRQRSTWPRADSRNRPGPGRSVCEFNFWAAETPSSGRSQVTDISSKTPVIAVTAWSSGDNRRACGIVLPC